MKRLLAIAAILGCVAPIAHAQSFATPADPKVAFITGPQLASGDATNPRPWFDTIAHDKGIYWAARYPAAAPMVLTGTLTVTSKSATVVGVGTRFLTEVDPNGFAPYFNHISFYTLLAGSTHRFEYPPYGFRTFKIVAAVADDTHLTLSTVYDGPTESGLTADTIYDIVENPGAGQFNIDTFMNWNYYDQGLIQYINYYRTGDTQFLTAARKIEDAWWQGPAFGSGLLAAGDGTTPRSSSVGGLILRAMDGKPQYWDAIRRYTRAKLDEWVKTRRDYALLHEGVRDGSYMLLYAAQLAKCLPDSYPLDGGGTETGGAAYRAGFLADVEDLSVNYYVRLQHPDGSWRWNLDSQVWFPSWYSGAPDVGLFQTMQAFHVGLLLQALGDVYFLSTNPTVKATLKAAILLSVTGIHTGGAFITTTYANTTPAGGYPILGYEYFFYGGSPLIPNAFEAVAGAVTSPIKDGGHPGGIGPGTPSWEASGSVPNVYKPLTDPLDVADRRSLAQTLYHVYGLAYYISGNTQYKTWGDLVFKGGFGEPTDADPGDGIHNYADAIAQWSYNETFRAGGRYLAFRVMTPEGASPPVPVRLPIPIRIIGANGADLVAARAPEAEQRGPEQQHARGFWYGRDGRRHDEVVDGEVRAHRGFVWNREPVHLLHSDRARHADKDGHVDLRDPHIGRGLRAADLRHENAEQRVRLTEQIEAERRQASQLGVIVAGGERTQLTKQPAHVEGQQGALAELRQRGDGFIDRRHKGDRADGIDTRGRDIGIFGQTGGHRRAGVGKRQEIAGADRGDERGARGEERRCRNQIRLGGPRADQAGDDEENRSHRGVLSTDGGRGCRKTRAARFAHADAFFLSNPAVVGQTRRSYNENIVRAAAAF